MAVRVAVVMEAERRMSRWCCAPRASAASRKSVICWSNRAWFRGEAVLGETAQELA